MTSQCASQGEIITLEILVFLVISLIIVVSVGTSVVVFGCRSQNERPKFVLLQMIFLNISCFFFLCYMIFKGKQVKKDSSETEDEKLHITRFQNILLTLGDLFIFLHDWIFVQQYILASYNLPIIIQILEGDNELLQNFSVL